jgi:hypothetical protein
MVPLNSKILLNTVTIQKPNNPVFEWSFSGQNLCLVFEWSISILFPVGFSSFLQG